LQELARAIAPDGPAKLIANRTQGSFLNGWVTSRAEASPETSGFATRQEWFKATPNDPKRRILWAEALMKNGRHVEAGMIAEEILVKDKNNVRAGLIMAEAHRLQGEFAKSGLEYTALIKQNPKLMPALLGMGQVALEKSLYPIALKVYTDATGLEPNNATAWVGLGRAHYNQRLNFGAAVDAFAKAKKLAPERTDFSISYANALRAIFRWDEAETLLRERLKDIPDDPEAHFQLATVLLDSKRNEQREAEAERLLRRSLELEPRAVASMARLGSLLVQHSNGKEAIPYLEAVIADDIFHVAATKDLATAYRLAGRLKEAKSAQESFSQLTVYMEKRNFLDDLLRREPMKADLHDKLAALLESGGETNKAKLHRDAALMLRKDPKKAKLGLQALNDALASTEIVNESTKKR
jgi:tetratricopeptide (TPR) repeat protein